MSEQIAVCRLDSDRESDPLWVGQDVACDTAVRLRVGTMYVVVEGHELIGAVEKAMGLDAVKRGSRS